MALPLTDTFRDHHDVADTDWDWPPRLALVPSPVPPPAVSPSRHRRAPAPAVLRRRRAGVLIMAGLAVAVGLAVVDTPSGGTGRGTLPATGTETAVEYVVQPGDTLWEIAGSISPGGDRRETVDRLTELNGGPDLAVGQRLVLATPA